MPGLDPGIQAMSATGDGLLRLHHGQRQNGTLYVGVTHDLVRRIYEHRNGLVEGFTKRYDVKHLVYFEETSDVHSAQQREQNIKHWSRTWRMALIERTNPDWRDLYQDIVR